jgi:hypothetical protein
MKKAKQYIIEALHPITKEVLVTSDTSLSTKAAAKDMVDIMKLVNRNLVYKIKLKEQP